MRAEFRGAQSPRQVLMYGLLLAICEMLFITDLPKPTLLLVHFTSVEQFLCLTRTLGQ